MTPIPHRGLPRWRSGKESACQCRRLKRHAFDPWVGKISWRRKLQPTPVFLPEEFHAQRSLAVCSPWDRKESDTTKQLTLSFHFQSPGTSLMKNSSWNFMEGNYGNLDEAVFFLVFQISLSQGAFLSKYRNSIIFLQNQNLFVFYLFCCCCCCLGKEMFLLKKKKKYPDFQLPDLQPQKTEIQVTLFFSSPSC